MESAATKTIQRSGERYGSKTLSKLMKVSADKEVILQSVDSPPIKEGTRTGGRESMYR
jgi:hypothetical protein